MNKLSLIWRGGGGAPPVSASDIIIAMKCRTQIEEGRGREGALLLNGRHSFNYEVPPPSLPRSFPNKQTGTLILFWTSMQALASKLQVVRPGIGCGLWGGLWVI